MARGMTDPHQSLHMHEGPRCSYHLVFFEEPAKWFIRCDDRNSKEQCWSAEGWDDKAEALRAFATGGITYKTEAPGRS